MHFMRCDWFVRMSLVELHPEIVCDFFGQLFCGIRFICAFVESECKQSDSIPVGFGIIAKEKKQEQP